jgi:hypothetical protein
MREVMEQAAMAYRGARAQLAQLEALRDGLGQRLAQSEEVHRPVVIFADRRGERSAA